MYFVYEYVNVGMLVCEHATGFLLNCILTHIHKLTLLHPKIGTTCSVAASDRETIASGALVASGCAAAGA